MGCTSVVWPGPWGSPGGAESSQPPSPLPHALVPGRGTPVSPVPVPLALLPRRGRQGFMRLHSCLMKCRSVTKWSPRQARLSRCPSTAAGTQGCMVITQSHGYAASPHPPLFFKKKTPGFLSTLCFCSRGLEPYKYICILAAGAGARLQVPGGSRGRGQARV